MIKTIPKFLNEEYKEFSLYNNKRMIPSIIDGFKPVQRKIIYSLSKRPNQLIKVTQLAGYVIAETDYIHGESSLHQAIISMARDYEFIYPLLIAEGQFGTRLESSSAAPRYLYTKLNKELFYKIFRKEDEIILNYTEEKEPEHYYPIIPLVLLQSQTGLGVGFKSSMTPYSAKSIIEYILSYLDGNPSANIKLEKQFPYYKGKIEQLELNKYRYHSVVSKLKDDTYIIEDLPPTYSLLKIREKLLAYKELGLIQSFEDQSSENQYHIIVRGLKDPSILNIDSTITDSLVFFDTKDTLKEYSSVYEILDEFISFRLNKYEERIQKQISILQEEISSLNKKLEIITKILQNPKEIDKIEDSILSQISLNELKRSKIEDLKSLIQNKLNQLESLKKTKPTILYKKELQELSY